jgi:hypothetical protein
MHVMCEYFGMSVCVVMCVLRCVCGQHRNEVGVGGPLGGVLCYLVWWCAREDQIVTLLVSPTLSPRSQPSHTVLATNPHTLHHHVLQTLRSHTSTRTRSPGGERRGMVVWWLGAAPTNVTGFQDKRSQTHAHNFRGIVCIYIQSPKHLQSFVHDFPHHQA